MFSSLVLRRATAQEFDDALDAALAGQSDPVVRAALTQERRDAWEVAERLRWHENRGTQLQALFDTAGDLAAQQDDVDAVLQAMVRRARRLLSADLAVLSLVDDDTGTLYTRATDGSVSERLQSANVPRHLGLAGLVLRSRVPVASYDYANDRRFPSTRMIQSHMSEEGIRGIVGAPLRAGNRTFGVLFAAQREQRLFDSEETALLQTVADHSALALNTARLIARLQTENRTMRNLSEESHRVSGLLDELTDLLLHDAGVERLLQRAGDMVDAELELYSPHGQCIASGRASGPGLVRWTPGLVERAAAQGLVRQDDGVCVVPVEAGHEMLGLLALSTEPDPEALDGQLFRRAVQLLALTLRHERLDSERVARQHRELLGYLVESTSPESADQARGAARRVAVDLEVPLVVVVCTPETGSDQHVAVPTLASLLAQEWRPLVAEYFGSLVVVADRDDPAAFARQVADRLHALTERPFTISSAGPARGPVELARAYDEARRTIAVLRHLGLRGQVGSLADLGYHGLLLGPEPDVAAFIERQLGPVLRYDAERGTDLLATLRAFFRHAGRTKDISAGLHLHPNTVAQRLRRIGELLDQDITHLVADAQLQLALSLHDLQSSLSPLHSPWRDPGTRPT